MALWRRFYQASLFKSILVFSLASLSMSAYAEMCRINSYYQNDKEGLRFVFSDHTRQGSYVYTLKNVDRYSFQTIKFSERFKCQNNYGRDNQHVFFKGHVIEGADPETFVRINHIFARDKGWVYAHGRRITNRIENFKLLDGFGYYATDGARHFYEDTLIEGPGFELLRANYARTNMKVFHKGKVVPGADPATFDVYLPEYSITRDKRYVYHKDLPLQGADPATFERIGLGLFRDKRAVYSNGLEIRGADPKSARQSKWTQYTIDKEHVFYGTNKVNLDAKTFEDLNSLWARDKKEVYYMGKKIPNADSQSFRMLSSYKAEDKNYQYMSGVAICKTRPDAQGKLPVCQ